MTQEPYDPTKAYQPTPQQYAPPYTPGYPQPPQGATPLPPVSPSLDQQFVAWPPPTAPKKGWGTGKVILAIVGGVFTLCMIGVIGTVMSSNKSSPRAASGNTVAPASPQPGAQPAGEDPAPAAVEEPPAATRDPVPSDFKLAPKVTRKHCFGSAGCNVDFEVKVAYGGPTLSDEDTWMITFDVTGDEDGPMTDSVSITGTEVQGQELSVSTASSRTKLTIKVTSVDRQ